MAVKFSTDNTDNFLGHGCITQGKTSCTYLTIDEDDLAKCAEWISSLNLKRIALQLPDELLKFSCFLINNLKENTQVEDIFILGDTSYGSCCVDEVAAEHGNADGIIHFGHACLSSTLRTSVLYIFGKAEIDVDNCIHEISNLRLPTTGHILLLYDVVYSHVAGRIYERLLEDLPNLIFTSISSEFLFRANISNASLYNQWILKRMIHTDQSFDSTSGTLIYIGHEGAALNNIVMTLNKMSVYSYDPCNKIARKESVTVNKSLMKRYFRVEQARVAKIIGIVAGTLGISNYLEVINYLKFIIKKSGKKSFIFSVGKLNVAKLANFMEIDVFVLVACPENTLLDSSDFYKPIITPYELELACNPSRQWTGQYITDYSQIIPGGSNFVEMGATDGLTDMSLITGNVYGLDEDMKQDDSSSLVTRDDFLTVSQTDDLAASYLSTRSFQGLEIKLGETDVSHVIQGQSGLPVKYENV